MYSYVVLKCSIHFIDSARMVCGRVYVTASYPSVCPISGPGDQEISIDCCTGPVGAQHQLRATSHVVS